MRRMPLVAMVLVSAVVCAVLALLAPSAAAGADTPGNRGWVAGDTHRGDD